MGQSYTLFLIPPNYLCRLYQQFSAAVWNSPNVDFLLVVVFQSMVFAPSIIDVSYSTTILSLQIMPLVSFTQI